MDNNLNNIFKKAIYIPENRLSNDILLAISDKDRKNAHIKLWVNSTIGVFSFVGFFPAFKLLLSDFAQSGFYQYLSLVFSDGHITSYWKEIILSITESIPMISLTLSLALVFIFILSLRFIARNIRVRPSLLAV